MALRQPEKKEETGVAPHFVQPLKPLVVREHEPALLQCAVAGQPTPTVKWYRADKEIRPDQRNELTFVPETGLATLRILEPTDDDQTIYSVKAINTFGRAECRANLIVSEAVTVHKPVVMYAPKITLPLKAMIVPTGNTMTLEARFEGAPTPEVKWYRNGKEVVPKTGVKITTENFKTTLNIPKAAKEDGGKYEVRAVNPAGEARCSGSVAVRVPEPEMAEVVPPRFIEPIYPQIVAEGEVVIMETRVESHPTCSFQWFQHSVPIKSSPELRVVTTDNHSVLLVREILPEHAGSYTCRAENVAGSVTCTATLNVLPEVEWQEPVELASPTFVQAMEPQRVMDGERVEFSCQVKGKPTPRVSWFHKSQPVKEAKDVTFYQDSEGVCKLAISEVFPEDAGEYTCQAVNRVGEAVCAASLVVEAYEYVPDSEIEVTMGTVVTEHSSSEENLLAKKELQIVEAETGIAPHFVTKLPTNIPARDGELTRLEVKVEGSPRPRVRWYKQGVEIVSSQDFQLEDFDDGTSVLTITEVFPDDSGEILCEARNELGVDQTLGELDVQGIVGTKEYRKPEWVTHMEELQEALRATQCVPTFVLEIKDVRSRETEAVTFECQYQGMPVPDIVWYRNDKLVSNTKNVKIVTKNLRSSLNILHVTPEDAGTYVCKATSQIGETSTRAKLYVQELPREEKKEFELQKARETEEKVKMEKIQLEKKRLDKRQKKGTVTFEEVKETAGVTETQVLESTSTSFTETTETRKAERVISVAESVETTAVASCKKIDVASEQVLEIEEKAVPVAAIQESVSVSEVQPEDVVKELAEKKPKTRRAKPEKKPAVKETATVTEVKTSVAEEIMRVEEVRMAREVEETMQSIRAHEFGAGESPLRELAKIGFLVRHGVSVNEITALYQADLFPALRTPQAQSALVQVVERRGYGTLVSQILTEESTTDETLFAATVGFRAFMRMVELNYATVEEVITHFSPDDFGPHVWETTEASQMVTKEVAEQVEVTQKTAVQQQERASTSADLPRTDWTMETKTWEPEIVVIAIICVLLFNFLSYLLGLVFSYQTEDLM